MGIPIQVFDKSIYDTHNTKMLPSKHIQLGCFKVFLDVFQPETSGNGSTLTHIFSGTIESTNQILKSLYDWLVV